MPLEVKMARWVVLALLQDFLIGYVFHRIMTHHVPTVEAQVWGTAAGGMLGGSFLLVRTWSRQWRRHAPSWPLVAIRLIVWMLLGVAAGMATAMEPAAGTVLWALWLVAGGPEIPPMVAHLCRTHRANTARIGPRIPAQREPVFAGLVFENTGDGT